MIVFNKQVGDITYEFRPVYISGTEPRYHVYFVDDEQHVVFRMKKHDQQWKIIDQKLPDFVWKAENELSFAILEHEATKA